VNLEKLNLCLPHESKAAKCYTSLAEIDELLQIKKCYCAAGPEAQMAK